MSERLNSKCLPQKMIERMAEVDRKAMGLKTREELQAGFTGKQEKVLQKECEKYLSLCGYYRLTAQNAVMAHSQIISGHEKKPLKGWYGHLFKAQQNAFMPDLFIVDRYNRFLWVELKVHERYRQGQKEMIEMGWWQKATTFDEFIVILKEWEAGK